MPPQPKIYHIAHVDRLASIVTDGFLWCDAEIIQRASAGTSIGMSITKERRLLRLKLTSHPDLHVGDCVPFYFCPRSVMLYMIHMANHPALTYRGGQEPILHFEADLHATIQWANAQRRRWAFTSSNAASRYFEDYSDLADLEQINWAAVDASDWRADKDKEGKQAEFLLEHCFPWHLIERIGVRSDKLRQQVGNILPAEGHCPAVEVRPDWYY